MKKFHYNSDQYQARRRALHYLMILLHKLGIKVGPRNRHETQRYLVRYLEGRYES